VAARRVQRQQARQVERAVRAIAWLARARLSPAHPWLTEFENLLSEDFLTENAAQHRPLIELVEELAAVGTAGRTPRLLEAGMGSGAFALHFSRRRYDVVASTTTR
jgi:hypothetical protein